MSNNAATSTGTDTLRNLPENIWISLLFRALPALAGALVITFTQDHNARFGFAVFGAVVLWSGIIVGFEGIGVKGHPARVYVLIRSLLNVLAGGFSLFMATGGHDWATAQSFIITVASWGIATGIVELLAAFMSRKHAMYSSEILIAGALTLLLGVIVAFVPPELNDQYGGIEQIEGSLTADVQSIGFVGAYFAILGVLLVIEAISLRAALRRRAQEGAKEGAAA